MRKEEGKRRVNMKKEEKEKKRKERRSCMIELTEALILLQWFGCVLTPLRCLHLRLD